VTERRLGRWVCVDGVEGVGKSTLTEALGPLLDAVPINEFSKASFGTALREAVNTSPHFISHSPVGQSLVFLGDFIELFESEIIPALETGKMVITDRGWVSKYAYQRSVLEERLSSNDADELVRKLLSYIPQPDLTVLLTAPLPVLRDRLIERDGSCNAGRLAFIRKASDYAEEIATSLAPDRWITVDTNRPKEEVAARVSAWICNGDRRAATDGEA
jgi:dTMP kinase